MYYIISESLINLIGSNFIFHSGAEPKSVKSLAASSEACTIYNEHSYYFPTFLLLENNKKYLVH